MINFSGIPARSVIGKILRLPLRLLPPGTVLPVLQGKLKGKKWLADAGSHGFWLGSYEFHKQRVFSEMVKPDRVVYDVGANVGFYTILASVLVGPRGRVISFEPLPRNLAYLRGHVALNRCSNVTVVEAAVGEASGPGLFKEVPNPSAGHIVVDEGFPIQVVSLDDLVARGTVPPPDYMKIDVEGAELLALMGARRVLIEHRPTVFLAVHGTSLKERCWEFLSTLGFDLRIMSEGSEAAATDTEVLGTFGGSS